MRSIEKFQAPNFTNGMLRRVSWISSGPLWCYGPEDAGLGHYRELERGECVAKLVRKLTI